MSKTLARIPAKLPSVFDDLFKPWNDWFDNGNIVSSRMLTIPAVNVTDSNEAYVIAIAVPGLKKEDLNIDVEGNLITISAEISEDKEENTKMFTREEYNYSCFSRTFTLPDEVKKEKIDAEYKDGILKIHLPKTEEAKKQVVGKHIAIR